MSDLIRVSIPNWEEYNARSDRANYSWFRFQNDFFQNQKMFGLSDSQWVLFLMLICEVSKKNKSEVCVSPKFLAAIRQTTAQKIIKDLQQLVTRGVVVVDQGHQLVESLPATDRQTDITDKTDIQAVGGARPLHDLARVWNEHRGDLGEVKEVGKERSRHIAERLKECPNLATWAEVTKRLAASDFCNGRVDGKKWKATFDFLLRPKTRIKALEGAYDNIGGSSVVGQPGYRSLAQMQADGDL